MCGIVGAISAEGRSVFADIANAAHFLQHRGPAYAGIFTMDPEARSVHLEKGEGLADDIFKPLRHMRGDIGIAHTRYRTFGAGGVNNAQPFFDPFSCIGLAHNGHITNVPQISEELGLREQRLMSDCDAEPLLRVLGLWLEHYRSLEPGQPEHVLMFRAIRELQRRVTGAYSAVAATPSGLYAFRDPHGFRPMVMGRKHGTTGGSLMIASETLALEQNGFGEGEPVPPGASFFVDHSLQTISNEALTAEPMPCAFELIYFADVESTMMGDKIRSFRWRAGRALALHLLETAPELVEQIDLVVPIPHSPIPGAEAFARKLEKEAADLGIQYATPVSKYRFGGRVFMEETQEARDAAAKLDFRVDTKAVEGKNIFLLDDSIVRGTNASRIVAALRERGAGKVFFGALWPMVIDSCFQGINTPTQDELIGARFNRDTEKVRHALGVDALLYLPVERFQDKVLRNEPACMACATGVRAVAFRNDGPVLPAEPRAS